ncbi:hypothetical protein [uncultured Enterovirga sp.]|uniref:hypothetical protein n=1 Tax=uncultured Enterovirga sp. TaxID=2026352 RepID=UPI0035C9D11F
MHSGVVVLSAYVVFAIVGEIIAYFLGRQFESYYPSWSLGVFLAMFFLALVIAWPLAVMVTPEDKEPPPVV